MVFFFNNLPTSTLSLSLSMCVCVCLQFYSILDGDEDMLFMHVDNPGGNENTPTVKQNKTTF